MIATKAWYKHKTKQEKHKEKSYAKLRKKKRNLLKKATQNYAKSIPRGSQKNKITGITV